MNTTFITCFFDISRDKWNTCYRRTLDTYFNNADSVLNSYKKIIVYTEERFKERILKINRNVKVIITKFKDIPYYQYRDRIIEIMNNPIFKQSILELEKPEFCEPDYVILVWSKLYFIINAISLNLFNTEYFSWIDFGLHPHIITQNIKNIFSQRIRIPCFNRLSFNDLDLKSFQGLKIVSGFFTGSSEYFQKFYKYFNREIDHVLKNNIVCQEQYIYTRLCVKYPDLFFPYQIDKWDRVMTNYYNISLINLPSIPELKNKKIALCFSGHLRNWESTVQNLFDNLINPLKKLNNEVDIYTSTWDTKGLRNENFGGSVDIPRYIQTFNVKKIEVERSCRDYFYNNYRSENYKTTPRLSGPYTAPDAASMWYKIEKSFELLEHTNYDLVFRLRPDMFLNEPIISLDCRLALIPNVLCVPTYAGKYYEVQQGFCDHLSFGSYDTMKYYCSVFNEIKNLQKQKECVHTGEGYLAQHVRNNTDLIVIRTDVQYKLI